MRETFARMTLIALMALTLVVAAKADESRVVVRVYDTAPGASLAAENDAPAMRSAAIRVAAAIVSDAGLTVEWYDCTSSSAEPQCRHSQSPHNFIVRLLPTFVGGAGTPRISLQARTAQDSAESELGFAVIDPHTLAGAIATIFHDRVLAVSRRAGVERSELLGRALAHEVGHFLLKSTGHSRIGLMRPVWTDGELTQNRPEDWLFANADRIRLQQNLTRDADAIDLGR
jgi:hypothetical protein